MAQALAVSDETLLVPDFWLGEATNVLWLQVRRSCLPSFRFNDGDGPGSCDGSGWSA